MAKQLGIKKATNKKGQLFCLTTDGESFAVYALCENYDGKVRGGISKTWRYVKKDLTREEAEKIFNRRTT